MRILGVFLAHEARIQWRSLPFRVLVALYLALCAAPAAGIFAIHGKAGMTLGSSTYADAVARVQPALTALLSAVLGASAAVREPREGSLATLGVAPITNSGYLLRRWLSVATLTVLGTVPPPAAGLFLARAAGAPYEGAGPFIWPWLLHTVPVAFVCSAIGSGLSVAAGGPLRGATIGVLLGGLPLSIGNDVLARFGRHVAGAGAWLNLSSVVYIPTFFSPFFQYYVGPSSGAPMDTRLLIDVSLPRAALAAGFGLFLIGATPCLLGRTRRDLHPWRIRPGHPLRTMLKTVNEARVAMAPEPAPARADKVALLCGLAVLAGALTCVVGKAERYRARGTERYQAETAGRPAPTPPAVLPSSWDVRGSFDLEGHVRTQVSGEVKNTGPGPASHLAFSVNPDLAIEKINAAGRTTKTSRLWDRLSVDLDPPLGPGETETLRFLLDGRPGRDTYPFDERLPFSVTFGSFLHARLASQLEDLSRSYTVRAVSPRRVDLEGRDLMPVLRYETWKLTPPGKTSDAEGSFVPEESFFPEARITVDLQGPAGVTVADSCGDVSSSRNHGSRLSGGCSFSPASFVVRGGRLSHLGGEGRVGSVLVIPRHAPMAERHRPALDEASDLAQKAWRGVSSLRDAVVMEWPPPFDPSPRAIRPPGFEMGTLWTSGDRLVLIDESTLLSEHPLDPRNIAMELVARSLEHRRPVVQSEAAVFDRIWRTVAAMKLGVSRGGHAMVRKAEASASFLEEPILTASRWNRSVWGVKLPALLTWIEGRVGESGFTRGIDSFLSDSPGSLGTVRELLDTIGRENGVSLQRVYSDYFEGNALPILTLESVEFRRRVGGWSVSGLVRNLGSGETICPVVLRNEAGSEETTVRVGPDAAESFSLQSAIQPRTLLLDPLHRCYRYSPGVKTVDEVPYRETP